MKATLGSLLGKIPRPTPAMAVALLALLIACSGAAFAAIPSLPDGTITACYDQKTGMLRVIDTGQTCTSKEKQLAWKDGINGKVAESDKLDNKDSTEFLTQEKLDAEAANRQAADSTLQGNIDAEAAARTDADNQLRSDLKEADQAPNESGDPVDWSKLKGVPEGFADGEDAVGSSDPNAGLSGYEIVESSSPYDTFGLKGAQTECTSGKEVIGGGGAYSSTADGLQASGDDNIAIQWSRPFTLPGPNGQSGYTVMAGDVSTGESSPRSWRAIAWAICADVTSP